jgi:hypothetical protein
MTPPTGAIRKALGGLRRSFASTLRICGPHLAATDDLADGLLVGILNSGATHDGSLLSESSARPYGSAGFDQSLQETVDAVLGHRKGFFVGLALRDASRERRDRHHTAALLGGLEMHGEG